MKFKKSIWTQKRKWEEGCRVYIDVGTSSLWLASMFKPAKSTETGMEMLRALLKGDPAHRAAPAGRPSDELVREELKGLAHA